MWRGARAVRRGAATALLDAFVSEPFSGIYCFAEEVLESHHSFVLRTSGMIAPVGHGACAATAPLDAFVSEPFSGIYCFAEEVLEPHHSFVLRTSGMIAFVRVSNRKRLCFAIVAKLLMEIGQEMDAGREKRKSRKTCAQRK